MPAALLRIAACRTVLCFSSCRQAASECETIAEKAGQPSTEGCLAFYCSVIRQDEAFTASQSVLRRRMWRSDRLHR